MQRVPSSVCLPMSCLLTSLPSAARLPADFATFCGPLCRIRAARVHLLVSGLLVSLGRLFAAPCANKCGAWPYLLRLPKLNNKYGTGGKKIQKKQTATGIHIFRAISAVWVYLCRSSMCEMRVRSPINYCGSVFLFISDVLGTSGLRFFGLLSLAACSASVRLRLLTPLSCAARCAGFAFVPDSCCALLYAALAAGRLLARVGAADFALFRGSLCRIQAARSRRLGSANNTGLCSRTLL
jgi:hypothetical protein